MSALDRNGSLNRGGCGSANRIGSKRDLGTADDIDTVWGGQIWKVKPDETAKDENPCLWMQARVVQSKNCNNFYDCMTCKYDLGMRKQVDKGKQISWQDAMRRRPELERICRHSLTYRIARRVCAFDYGCASCDFDQFFEDTWAPKTKTTPKEIQRVKGFDVPMGHHFHNGHAWARIESGGGVRVGLDDFSMKLLGKPDALELPLMGKELRQNVVGWGLKRRDNLADVLSPVDGVIVEVNQRLRENPEAVNREPYGDGWLFLVRTPDIKKAVKSLMTDTQCLAWMDREVQTLEAMIEKTAGPLAADGGYLNADIYGNLPDLGWKNLTRTFLKT